MKKSVLFSMIAVAAIAVCGCQKYNFTPSQDKGEKTHLVTLNVSDPETRTSIVAVPGGYLSKWSVGDYIYLLEYNPDAEQYNELSEYQSTELQETDIVNGKASFTVEMNSDDPSEATYEYIATYGPYPYSYINYWESAEDDNYQYWAQRFDYTGEYIAPHMQIDLRFEEYQQPSADSFDPHADVMVSQPVETTGQLKDALSLKFARLGTIVKITLTGLQEYNGKAIRRSEFIIGQSFSKSFEILYDYKLEKYIHSEMIMPESDYVGDMPLKQTIFTIEPRDVFVKEDGTADLWLRIHSGELTDNFSITLNLEDEELGEVQLKRNVDLIAEGKTIEFNEGGMTVFSVGGWNIADIDGVYCEPVVNEAMNGFTATWEAVENAVGYDCYLSGYAGEFDENGEPEIKYEDTPLTPVDNGDGTWSVSVAYGLEPMKYTLHIKPVPAEGHCLMYDEYSSFDMNIGLPDVWYFYHDNFGGNGTYESVEGADNEYIIPFSPGVVRFQNIWRHYDEAWQALKASDSWFMYSTEPLKKMHSIELYSKNDSHLNFKVYASSSPNEHTKELEGTVVETSTINTQIYTATHKKVRYTFPEDETYQYYTICGDAAGIMMTNQVTYVYYFK